VRHLVTESTTFLYPEAGRITLGLEALRVSADPDLTVVTYVAGTRLAVGVAAPGCLGARGSPRQRSGSAELACGHE
jgi:hypothetical protein